MKIKHYYYFGNEVQKELNGAMLNENNWDVLRTQGDKAFALENDIEQYEKNCEQSLEYKEAAKMIVSLLKKNNISKVVSLGAGKGILEWHIKNQMPEVHMVCTDYASEGIEQLKRVFIKCDEIYRYDMVEGDYSVWKDATILMYRISTEFTKEEWKNIFNRIYQCGIGRIIFVPTELLTFKIMVKEFGRHILNRICGRKDIMCGWMYSRKEFIEMFQEYNIDEEYGKKADKTVFSLVK